MTLLTPIWSSDVPKLWVKYSDISKINVANLFKFRTYLYRFSAFHSIHFILIFVEKKISWLFWFPADPLGFPNRLLLMSRKLGSERFCEGLVRSLTRVLSTFFYYYIFFVKNRDTNMFVTSLRLEKETSWSALSCKILFFALTIVTISIDFSWVQT